ncbi:SapC family protein [Sphingomonas sp. RHCKR7]|uniref:SapC family protein n=1 Tax=Sphingomonas folli TaxID=2862497 RepID=UPI001C67A0B9|nr:SapC family protein [Sphingomonas folli]MBW6528415.1 SapC family protein [Sphingomonas folli]
MSALVALDPRRHRSLRFDAAAAGRGRAIAQLGRGEIALAACDMPLCLAKDSGTGRFNLVALMALGGDNLFAGAAGFHATYMPQAVLLGAFRLAEGGTGLAIDPTDAALGARGAALVDGEGAAPLVAELRGALQRLVEDVTAARALADALARHRLLRAWRLVLRRADAREHALDGLYTIDEAALAVLDDDAVAALHREGALAAAAVIAASRHQVERLRQLHAAANPDDRLTVHELADD